MARGGKRNQRTPGLNAQTVLILVIITITFLGSALFFWTIHSESLRSSIQAEARLSASLLAEDITSTIPLGTVVSGGADQSLSLDLMRIEDKIENENDVWIIDQAGRVYYHGGNTGDEDARDLLSSAMEIISSGREKHGMSVGWFGKQGIFLLGQKCCVVRPIYDGELYLVFIDHADTVIALQRRQFTLLLVIDGLLMLVMMVLVVNNFMKYRRQLIRIATTDELTGLANRKSFQEGFAEFLEQDALPDFSLFLLDIDYFKQINDNYGHAAGDHALRYLAEQIGGMVRQQGGLAGRWGGDEFIGVLPGSGEAAQEALTGLCRRIQVAELEDGFHMTISAGAVAAKPGMSLLRLTEQADRALYHSKAQGRNQATLYQQGMVSAAGPAGAEQPTVRLPDAPQQEAAAPSPETPREASGPVSVPWRSFRTRFVSYIKEQLISSTILGVHWMAPFVAGGGILIALAFLFDAASVNLATMSVAERANFGSITVQAATLKNIGGITFNFMLPIFAGFMAYGMAGEDAFMTGFVGGYMTINSNAGFIGAMIAGFAAGVITHEVRQFTVRLPAVVRKAAPIMIYPVFNLLLMQVISYLIITPLSASIGRLFTALLDYFSQASAVSSGTLSAMMMAVDMGGIINKVAYNYGVASILQGREDMMATVMIGGMVPPIGIALSMLLFRDSFQENEQERGISTLFMGLSFITEGALPFVFTDFLRVIPSCMLGSALAGMLSALFGCTLPAPHGGVFVFPVMGRPVLYIVALLTGSLVTAVTLGVWKRSAK